MSERMEWRPVSHLFKFWTLATWDDGIEDGDGISDWWIAIEHMAAPLGDDLRLCRLVAVEEAPDVPDADFIRGVMEATKQRIKHERRDVYQNEKWIMERCDLVIAWLDSIAKGGDNGNATGS